MADTIVVLRHGKTLEYPNSTYESGVDELLIYNSNWQMLASISWEDIQSYYVQFFTDDPDKYLKGE